MWIYTNTGFVSIVQDRANTHYLLVRARRRIDLETFLAGAWNINHIYSTPNNDYAYRCSVPRDRVELAVSQATKLINYNNFKDSIPGKDHTLSNACSRAWSVTCDSYGTGKYSMPWPLEAYRADNPLGDDVFAVDHDSAPQHPSEESYTRTPPNRALKKRRKNKGKRKS